MSLHSRATGSSLHENKRYKRDVRACATSAVSTTSPGSAIDGVTLSNGDRVLLTAQASLAQNGIYVWSGPNASMTRATDADEASDFTPGFFVFVREGTFNSRHVFVFTTITAVSLDVTELTFQSINTIGPLGPVGNQGVVGPSGAKGPQGVAAAEFDPPYVLVQDQRTSGTGGTSTGSGGVHTVTLNTLVFDDHGLVTSLASNQVTLAPGQYRVNASAPAIIASTNAFKIRLQNMTDSLTLVDGTTEFHGSNLDFTTQRAFLTGRFTLSSPKALAIQIQSTNAVQVGNAASLGAFEVYTIVEFWRVADEPPIGVQITQLPPRRRGGRVMLSDSKNPLANTLLPV